MNTGRSMAGTLVLVSDIVVVAIGHPTARQRRLAGRHGNHEDGQQCPSLLVEKID
jgi:hypothetical protein